MKRNKMNQKTIISPVNNVNYCIDVISVISLKTERSLNDRDGHEKCKHDRLFEGERSLKV